MSGLIAAICSFRLGGTDGVSIEASKWEWALRTLGFSTRRVAGEFADGLRPDDTWLAFLGIDPPPGAGIEPDALAASLAGVDLVVVENLCSLPLNVNASVTTADVLEQHEGRVLFHHHDLPWERPHLAHLDAFPSRRPNSLHVTINEQARDALDRRGIESVVIRNAFDLDPDPGDRVGTRTAFGFVDEDLVVLQPTRAIPRKDVGSGIRFAEAVQAQMTDRTVHFWITGPAEDGYGPELDDLVRAGAVPITIGRAPRPSDAYAAADITVLPSTWEGFGNPVIEATIADCPVAAARYPVLRELLALGLQIPDINDVAEFVDGLRRPDAGLRASNRTCLEEHFDLRDLPDRISTAITAVGWDRW